MSIENLEKAVNGMLPSTIGEERLEESSIDDDMLSEMLASHISIDSLIVELGGSYPQFSEILFDMWLNRVGTLPYDSKLTEFVYERLRGLDASAVLSAVGEDSVKFLLRASLYPPLDDVLEEALVEGMEARLLEIIEWGHQETVLELEAKLLVALEQNQQDAVLELEAKLLEALEWKPREAVLELIGTLERRGYPRRRVAIAIWAHILNKVISATGSKGNG
uniref:Uncharacterized protein n=1 Tax=Fervidicoccus fontis TaxID=683846 RepID=A0A7J3ZLV7_9CREN